MPLLFAFVWPYVALSIGCSMLAYAPIGLLSAYASLSGPELP